MTLCGQPINANVTANAHSGGMLRSHASAYLCTMEVPNPLRGPDKPKVIRFILADSQAIYTEGLSKIIALEEDIQLVAHAESVEQLLISLERTPADVVLVEGELLTAGTRVAELRRVAPDAKFIVQCVAANEEQTVKLFRHGIQGIISRSISPDLLLRCVRRIAAGETWIDNEALNWILKAYRVQGAELANPRTQVHLSPRQKAVITYVTRGMRNKEIAYEMGTSEQVIKNHLNKLFHKLGVEDRIELALFCIQNKLILDTDQIAAIQKTISSKVNNGSCSA